MKRRVIGKEIKKTFVERGAPIKIHMIGWGECLFFVGLTLVPITVLELRKMAKQKEAR